MPLNIIEEEGVNDEVRMRLSDRSDLQISSYLTFMPQYQSTMPKPKWSPIPLLDFLGILDPVSEIVHAGDGNGNIMSLQPSLRHNFDRLEWWLEEIAEKVQIPLHV